MANYFFSLKISVAMQCMNMYRKLIYSEIQATRVCMQYNYRLVHAFTYMNVLPVSYYIATSMESQG